MQDLIQQYQSHMTALFNVRVTLTLNPDGTVTRAKAKGVKEMTLTPSELQAHVEKMTAQLRKLLAL